MAEDTPNPYQPPEVSVTLAADAAESGANDYRRRKRNILFAVGGYAVVAGFLVGVLEEGAPLSRIMDVASLIVFAAAVIAWCRLDCQQRDIQLWRFFVLMVICCPGPVVTLIIYLFVSRGLGGFWASAKLTAFAGILFAVMFATCFAGEAIVQFLQ